MKQLIMTILALAATATAYAESDNDTIVINNARRVTIITSDSLQKIEVRGREGEDDYTYRNTIQLVDSNYVSDLSISNDRWGIMPRVKINVTPHGDKQQPAKDELSGLTALGIGLNAPTGAADGMDVKVLRSWEIWLQLVQWNHYFDRKRRNTFSVALGADWRNYRMTGSQLFTPGADGNVTLGSYPEGARPKFSRIKTFSWTGTVLFRHDFGGGNELAVGPVVCWNSYASIKNRYKQDGGSHRYTYKDINQRRFTVDFLLQASLASIPFYLKFSPNQVLQDGGLHFRSLSFGLYL